MYRTTPTLSFSVRVGGCGVVFFGELGFFLNPARLVFFYLNEMTHRSPALVEKKNIVQACVCRNKEILFPTVSKRIHGKI
jgi:hypothetical protein